MTWNARAAAIGLGILAFVVLDAMAAATFSPKLLLPYAFLGLLTWIALILLLTSSLAFLRRRKLPKRNPTP